MLLIFPSTTKSEPHGDMVSSMSPGSISLAALGQEAELMCVSVARLLWPRTRRSTTQPWQAGHRPE